jgi:hypothetical protein
MFGTAVIIAIVEGMYILNDIRQAPSISVAPPGSPPAATRAAEAVPVPEQGSVASTPDRTSTQAGRLVVRSEPSGAQVFLDGRAVGDTPLTIEDVPAGPRQLLVRHGGAELRQSIRIEAGGTLSVLAPFEVHVPVAPGYLTFATPIDVDVFEGGALLGTSRSQRIMLEAGVHNLLLVNDQLGFRSVQDVRVEPGRTAQLQVEVPQGTIHINARPWAEVLIGGRLVGETPIGNLSVAIGTHDIVFRHPQLGERKVRTTVSTTAPTRVSVDLTQPPWPDR